MHAWVHLHDGALRGPDARPVPGTELAADVERAVDHLDLRVLVGTVEQGLVSVARRREHVAQRDHASVVPQHAEHVVLRLEHKGFVQTHRHGSIERVADRQVSLGAVVHAPFVEVQVGVLCPRGNAKRGDTSLLSCASVIDTNRTPRCTTSSRAAAFRSRPSDLEAARVRRARRARLPAPAAPSS